MRSWPRSASAAPAARFITRSDRDPDPRPARLPIRAATPSCRAALPVAICGKHLSRSGYARLRAAVMPASMARLYLALGLPAGHRDGG